MEKLKRFALLLFIAVLGGVISVGAYKLVEQKYAVVYDANGNIHKASYDIKNITVPTFDFADVSEAVMPTVVHIKTVSNPKDNENAQADPHSMNPFDFFGPGFNIPQQQGPQMASGSGVIISPDGYIVTNNHVVDGADNIEVVLYDKRSFKADVIGRDKNTDMALIKIDANGLDAIKIGNSDDVRVGQWVLAVGNPFNLTSTVTAGIVSAKGRNISLLGGGASIESFIQTDAAVNPGNSGGALVNTKGELVGINTAIASQTGQYEGYSFAVPANIMKKVINDFRQYGEVQRGFIGVQIRDVDYKIAEDKGLNKPEGVLVESFSDKSAAEDAGIKKGDVITKIDGRSMNSVSELQETIGQHRPGDEVKMTVVRDGKEKEYSVILRNKDGKTGLVTSETKALKNELGVGLATLSDEQLGKLKIKSGVKVTEVKKGLFKDAGVPEGFVITSIDKMSIRSTNDVYRAINGKSGALLVEGLNPNGDKKYYVLEASK